MNASVGRSTTAIGAASLVAAALLVLPGTAAAEPHLEGASAVARRASGGALTYIKDHNVWVSHPDGSGAVPVTRDGSASEPYVSPSMSDAGVIAVGLGGEILRMTQGGRVLNRMNPEPLVSSASTPIDGEPAYVEISPDGSTIAYTLVSSSGCPIGAECGIRTATGYTRADHYTRTDSFRQTHFTTPSWVGSGRTLQSGGSSFEVMIHDLGGEPQHWFDEPAGHGIGDVELSPDGGRLAGAIGYQGAGGISYFDVVGDARTGAPPPSPTYRCTFSDSAGPLISPRWGPDGRGLAFASTSGVYVVADVAACGSSTVTLVAPGGSSPDWSPATYSPGESGAVTFEVTKKPRVTGKARLGKALRVTAGRWSPKPTSVRYQWKRNGHAIKRATRPRYLVTKADLRKRLSVTITVRKAGYRPKTVTVRAGRPGS